MVSIRKAGIDQIGTVASLAQAIWPATYKNLLSAEQIEYMMSLFYSLPSLTEQFAKHTFLITYMEEEPVGFASYSSTSAAGIYRLHKIYIDRTIQGRGLGKSLINYIVEEMKSSRGLALELNVKRDNPARLFYEKIGFRVIREENINIGNGYWLQDYVMRMEV